LADPGRPSSSFLGCDPFRGDVREGRPAVVVTVHPTDRRSLGSRGIPLRDSASPAIHPIRRADRPHSPRPRLRGSDDIFELPAGELAVLRLLADRRDELSRVRTQTLNPLRRLVAELIPGGAGRHLTAL
jgi:hypothetical protein